GRGRSVASIGRAGRTSSTTGHRPCHACRRQPHPETLHDCLLELRGDVRARATSRRFSRSGWIDSCAMTALPLVQLGRSELRVPPICLGTMTFGQQVDEASAHALLDHALERGLTFIDTAEMYAVPPRAETYGATERILGSWFAARPGVRAKVVLATK